MTERTPASIKKLMFGVPGLGVWQVQYRSDAGDAHVLAEIVRLDRDQNRPNRR